ncbi:MAG: quinone oxidoreductase, partial [Rhodospirillales bacterium]|nr:quinone oxidoreductase [Rhodospirillales bacterium]
HKFDEVPKVIGMEGAGVVTEVGPGVDDVKVGDRVCYHAILGSYSEERLAPAARLIPIPDGIDDKIAASMMMKGMTAEYLIMRCYPVKSGDTVLVHAAAGGVGTIICQWLKHIGATVIGTVSTDAKVETAKAHGCDHVIVSSKETVSERVKEITDGKGVPVVYDGIGKDTFDDSLDCLSPRGYMVSFGNSSGTVEPVRLAALVSHGSAYLTRPTIATYCASREDLLMSANALFDAVKAGHVKIPAPVEYSLADAAQSHTDLESRKTTGSLILIP